MRSCGWEEQGWMVEEEQHFACLMALMGQRELP